MNKELETMKKNDEKLREWILSHYDGIYILIHPLDIINKMDELKEASDGGD